MSGYLIISIQVY